mgnify:CR=1 FL=1
MGTYTHSIQLKTERTDSLIFRAISENKQGIIHSYNTRYSFNNKNDRVFCIDILSISLDQINNNLYYGNLTKSEIEKTLDFINKCS